IQDWIAAGADCDDGSAPRPEPGQDGDVSSTDGGAPSDDGPGAETTMIALPPALVSVTPPRWTMPAGAKVGVTIALSRAAPAAGLTLSVALGDSSIVAS